MNTQRLSAMEIEILKRRIRDKQYISNKWYSGGWNYVFEPTYFNRRWYISAGCRRWNSFAQMRDHYDKSWVFHCGGRYGRRAEKHRREALAICRSMQRFAKRFKMKMLWEPRR